MLMRRLAAATPFWAWQILEKEINALITSRLCKLSTSALNSEFIWNIVKLKITIVLTRGTREPLPLPSPLQTHQTLSFPTRRRSTVTSTSIGMLKLKEPSFWLPFFEGLQRRPARRCRPSSGTGPPPPAPPPQHLQKTGPSPCHGPKSARNPPRAGALGLLQGCSSQILCPFSLGPALVCGYIAGAVKIITWFSGQRLSQ